jgi:RNA polymerase sigma-70 factor, ECF subfamily
MRLASRTMSQRTSLSTMSESVTHDAIEAIARDSYGRLVAYIASRTGDIADAQDALSEALVAALE